MAKVAATSVDVLNQIKDQYQARERENENRHREEVRELRDVHRTEIERVRSESQKRVQDVQEESSAKLNQKDLQFQKEVESLKSFYMRRVAEGKKPSS